MFIFQVDCCHGNGVYFLTIIYNTDICYAIKH